VKYNEVLPVWKVKILSSREDDCNTLELGQALLEFEGEKIIRSIFEMLQPNLIYSLLCILSV